MCGIFGYIGPDAEHLDFRAIIASIRHRGPDDESWVARSKIALAHTRLSIIDLSRVGRQPMLNPRGAVWVVLNGEIYNYLELREALSDYPYQTNTDTEVILAAYERWGEGALKKMRGMFSLGIYDEKADKLIIAVDRFGIKPCYYYQNEKKFYFASEIKALESAGVSLSPDDQTIYEYLLHGRLTQNSHTFFEGICQLRGGEFLVVDHGKPGEIRRYWEAEPPRLTPHSFDEWLEIAESGIRESVALHLRSDVEYGLALSSGLDSNFLRCMIPEVGKLQTPLKCFSFCFSDTEYDECVGLQKTDSSGVAYHLARITSDNFWEKIPSLLRMQEGPLAGIGFYGFYKAMKLASDSGIKVILSGQGADELFCGYEYYYELRLKALLQTGDKAAFEKELRLFAKAHGLDRVGDIDKLRKQIAGRDETKMYASDGTDLAGQGYVTREFAEQYHSTESPVQVFDCEVRNRMHSDLFRSKIPKLLRFQDKMAMASAVEVRVPFLDHILYELAFSIPQEYTLHEGYTKFILRKLAAGFNDPVSRMYWQPVKRYMITPQREWLKYELTDQIRTLISESILHDRGYVDKRKVSNDYEAWVASPSLGNSYFIWKFINLEFMFKEFGW